MALHGLDPMHHAILEPGDEPGLMILGPGSEPGLLRSFQTRVRGSAKSGALSLLMSLALCSDVT